MGKASRRKKLRREGEELFRVDSVGEETISMEDAIDFMSGSGARMDAVLREVVESGEMSESEAKAVRRLIDDSFEIL
jgi:hypothetical protein